MNACEEEKKNNYKVLCDRENKRVAKRSVGLRNLT